LNFYLQCKCVLITGPNIALHKPASQSPDTYLQGSASKAVDGNTSDNVAGNKCAHTAWGNPALWTVDLEETFNLSGIKIYNRNKHS